MNNGEGGAELFFSCFSTAGREAVGFKRRLPNDVEVLIPRFLRFRGFFAGVVGLCSSKKVLGDESWESLSVLRDRKSATKDVAVFATGDSGDGPGDGSVTEDESMVDMVVVGELSEEAVDVLSRLSRWMWKEEKGTALWGLPLVCGLVIVPCALVPSALGNGLRCVLRASSPKTEPNEGMAKDLGLVCILGVWAPAGGPDLGERVLVLLSHGDGLEVRSEDVRRAGVRLSLFEGKQILRVKSALSSGVSLV